MKIENVLNLPEPLVEAVRGDSYTKGQAEFSTTELIGPPRIAQLKQKWKEHLVEDVSDHIFRLLGKSIHTILEHSQQSKRYLIEKRFYAEVGGHIIGGQVDLFDLKESSLEDWKLTSYHTTSDAIRKYPWSSLRTVPEGKGWISQGNVNKYLMFRNGYDVKQIRYIALYRDWSKSAASRSADYPPRQVEILIVPKWGITQTEDYLRDRIKLHIEARTNLPRCTPEEMWERPEKWAVMKEGAKRAVKLYESEQQAEAAVANPKQYVEHRLGERVRCESYCDVAPFCTQFREYRELKEIGQALLRDKMEAA